MTRADIIRSADFWKDQSCYVADGGLAYVECGGGSVIFETSGSTGQPKYIVLRKDALLLSAHAVNDWLGVNPESVWGLALPMDHVGGFGVAARAYAAGCGFSECVGKWDAKSFVEWLVRERVSHVSLVPTQIHDLLAAGLRGAPSLRAVVVGGGRLSDEMGQAARDAGWPVLASYGMTEAGSQVATQSITALELPFVEGVMELLPIWDAEVTADGLLRLRGDALFCGVVAGGNYHPRVGEWFTTNDRAEVSGTMIRPLGRADTRIKVLGELVDVEGVERDLIGLCGVSLAVIALPDARRENELVAVFEGEVPDVCVADYNSRAPGPERIMRSCGIGAFPRSGMGKLLRAKLAELCGK